MKKPTKLIIQILFLTLFAVLIVTGKIQLWMGIFIIGIILSIFLSRFYCAFACPINTLMNLVTFLKRKLGIKSFKTPDFLTKKIVRYIVLGMFIATFAFVMISGKKLPVVPFITSLGVLLTFFFPEELWHRYLCPYGTILSVTSSKAKKSITIDPSKCNNCTACVKVCPSKAIGRNDNSHFITKNECLTCFECTRVCRQNTISF